MHIFMFAQLTYVCRFRHTLPESAAIDSDRWTTAIRPSAFCQLISGKGNAMNSFFKFTGSTAFMLLATAAVSAHAADMPGEGLRPGAGGGPSL
jgi:hypothetical protein